jgi:hypothetical protein
MDSRCSCHRTRGKKLFSSLDPVIGKEYITFGDKSRGKVISRCSIRVNESFVLKDVDLVLHLHLHFNLLSISQLLEDGYEVSFKRACLRFWMLVGILFVRFPLLFEFSVLTFHTLLAHLDVCWQDLLLLSRSGIGGLVT